MEVAGDLHARCVKPSALQRSLAPDALVDEEEAVGVAPLLHAGEPRRRDEVLDRGRPCSSSRSPARIGSCVPPRVKPGATLVFDVEFLDIAK
jgi:hypothetical protein